MNTSLTPTVTTRAAGAALALVLTLTMLLGINTLATQEGGAPLMARAQAAAQV